MNNRDFSNGMNGSRARVLVVDEDPALRTKTCEILRQAGHFVTVMEKPFGLDASQGMSVDVAVVDVQGGAGLELMRALKGVRPEMEVILTTSAGSVQTAQDALKAGAYDYLTKPWRDVDELRFAVAKAAEHKALKDRVRTLEQAAQSPSLADLPYAEAKRAAMRSFERRYLNELLERSGRNISSAARAAGVDRSNFRRLLKQYEVTARPGVAAVAQPEEEGASGPLGQPVP